MANAFKSLLSAGFKPVRGLPYTNELWWQLTKNEKNLIIKQLFLRYIYIIFCFCKSHTSIGGAVDKGAN